MTPGFPNGLDEFDPIELIGSGGFGDVWLAKQTQFDRLVAIKVGKVPMTDSDQILRFERECTALGRLTGKPHIVVVHTSGLAGANLPYLVMEHVDGGTLKTRGTNFSETQLRTVTLQLCSAIQDAHDAGVLHRDLKPENVFIRKNGETVVGDFGIARVAGAERTSEGTPATLLYAAPEVLELEQPTPATDVYGIGVTIISASLGRSPFDSKDDPGAASVISRVVAGVADLETIGLSANFLAILSKAMAKDPADRHSSVSELAAAVSQLDQETQQSSAPTVASSQPSQVPEDSQLSHFKQHNQRGRKTITISVVIAAFAISAIGLLGFNLSRSAPDQVVPIALPATTIEDQPTTSANFGAQDAGQTTVETSTTTLLPSPGPTTKPTLSSISEYSFPLELAEGNGCQAAAGSLGDGTWYVTFPDGFQPTAGTLAINLICAFSAQTISENGVQPDFVGWLFEDRSPKQRSAQVSPSVYGEIFTDSNIPFEIQITDGQVTSATPAG